MPFPTINMEPSTFTLMQNIAIGVYYYILENYKMDSISGNNLTFAFFKENFFKVQDQEIKTSFNSNFRT